MLSTRLRRSSVQRFPFRRRSDQCRAPVIGIGPAHDELVALQHIDRAAGGRGRRVHASSEIAEAHRADDRDLHQGESLSGRHRLVGVLDATADAQHDREQFPDFVEECLSCG